MRHLLTKYQISTKLQRFQLIVFQVMTKAIFTKRLQNCESGTILKSLFFFIFLSTGLIIFLFLLLGVTESQSLSSAFSAVRNTSFTPSTNLQDLPFTQTHTNVGEDFSIITGRFNCKIPGLYHFSYTIMTTWGQAVQLVKNNVRINSVFRDSNSLFRDTDRFGMNSNTAVLQLAIGDQVWLQSVSRGLEIRSSNALFTTFSGINVEPIYII